MLANKQNCFDDFMAGAQYLINEKYTQSSRLVTSTDEFLLLCSVVVSTLVPINM